MTGRNTLTNSAEEGAYDVFDVCWQHRSITTVRELYNVPKMYKAIAPNDGEHNRR